MKERMDSERYSRQMKLKEVGRKGQEKITRAGVLIVGVGGLGCPAAQYLVAAGIGKLGLMDFDKVEISNLHRQVLYTESDIGTPKVKAAAKRLHDMNTNVEIECFQENLSPENALSIFNSFDLIIDGTDNFTAKYLINDAALKTNKPWIYASIYKHQGQLSVFNYKNGPTYRCVFPAPSQSNKNCEETGVMGILPGVLGTYQAGEALKIILKLDNVISGRLKIINGLTLQEESLTLTRNEKLATEFSAKPLSPELATCAVNKERFYLDVREYSEYPKPDSKAYLNIPVNQLKTAYEAIPKDRKVYVFCQSGNRSKKAVELLQAEYGFDNLLNVEGGIESIIV